MTSPRLSADDVARARTLVARHLRPTPVRRAFALRELPDAYVKLECWQPTGSFKVRGALALLAGLTPEQRRHGVVAASAGNHALGVAFAAQALVFQMPVALFVPETAPRTKIEKLRRFPVTLHCAGAGYDDAHALAVEHAQRTGATYVHAFDDLRTAAGQGTLGLELLEELPELGTVLVPVGGGALLTGIAVAMKAERPRTRIVAVQPEASPALAESLRLGRPLLEYAAAPTLADGLAGGTGEIVFRHRDLIDEVVLVSEREIEDAIVALLGWDQVVAEGAGAAPVAALLAGRARDPEGRPSVAIVSGANIDAAVLARLLKDRS